MLQNLSDFNLALALRVIRVHEVRGTGDLFAQLLAFRCFRIVTLVILDCRVRKRAVILVRAYRHFSIDRCRSGRCYAAVREFFFFDLVDELASGFCPQIVEFGECHAARHIHGCRAIAYPQSCRCDVLQVRITHRRFANRTDREVELVLCQIAMLQNLSDFNLALALRVTVRVYEFYDVCNSGFRSTVYFFCCCCQIVGIDNFAGHFGSLIHTIVLDQVSFRVCIINRKRLIDAKIVRVFPFTRELPIGLGIIK